MKFSRVAMQPILISLIVLAAGAAPSFLPDSQDSAQDPGQDSATDSSFISNIAANIVTKIVPGCVFGVDGISFVMYSREHQFGVELDDESTTNIPCPKISGFLIHGFMSEANNSNYYDLAQTWINEDDVCIISVNWKDAACNSGLSFTDVFAYKSAVDNIPKVAERILKFFLKLWEKMLVSLDNVSFIGHSLGAQVAGQIGKQFTHVTGKKLPTIMALDPAGPLFEDRAPSDRISPSDAECVQAFHTSNLGMSKPVGKTDFYYNTGCTQPNCFIVTCSHSRAVIYMTSTLLPGCKFTGIPYDPKAKKLLKNYTPADYVSPGIELCKTNVAGSYYVQTTCHAPYCSTNTTDIKENCSHQLCNPFNSLARSGPTTTTTATDWFDWSAGDW